MGRCYERRPGSRSYINYTKDDLEKALSLIRSHQWSQRQVAEHFGIPRSTLKNKLRQSHPKKPGGQPIISPEEEGIIANHCLKLSEYGFPVDTEDLRGIIKNYLDRKGTKICRFKDNYPGIDWAKGFLKRNSALSMRLSNNIKKKRAEISEGVINLFFENLAKELVGVDQKNIWNYDETNLTDDPGSMIYSFVDVSQLTNVFVILYVM